MSSVTSPSRKRKGSSKGVSLKGLVKKIQPDAPEPKRNLERLKVLHAFFDNDKFELSKRKTVEVARGLGMTVSKAQESDPKQSGLIRDMLAKLKELITKEEMRPSRSSSKKSSKMSDSSAMSETSSKEITLEFNPDEDTEKLMNMLREGRYVPVIILESPEMRDRLRKMLAELPRDVLADKIIEEYMPIIANYSKYNIPKDVYLHFQTSINSLLFPEISGMGSVLSAPQKVEVMISSPKSRGKKVNSSFIRKLSSRSYDEESSSSDEED